MMERKGYYGSIHMDQDSGVFFGKVEFVRALISYEGKNARSLIKAFREAVDDYLALCDEEGIKPETPFKGSFNVRVGSELHRKAALAARRKGVSLNNFAKKAFQMVIEKE